MTYAADLMAIRPFERYPKVVTLSWTRLGAALGGLAMSLTAGAGIASAQPDLSPAVNTTCNYAQVVAAMNAQFSDAAAQFNGSPAAQGWLQNFLAASPDQRPPMLDQLQATPGAAQFIPLLVPLANACKKY